MPNESIVAMFAKRQASNSRVASVKTAQEGGDLSGLFEKEEPKKKPFERSEIEDKGKPKHDKKEHSEKPKDDIGGDLMIEIDEEKTDCDEICSLIETGELSPEDIDQIKSCLDEKKNTLMGDSIDTEMDRPEAEMKNDMRKGPEKKMPLENEAMGANCSTAMY